MGIEIHAYIEYLYSKFLPRNCTVFIGGMDMQNDVMVIRPDIRAFENYADMHGECRKCGNPLVMLPDDRRMGYCFDCIDLLEISRKQEPLEGRVITLSHDDCFAMH